MLLSTGKYSALGNRLGLQTKGRLDHGTEGIKYVGVQNKGPQSAV